MAKEKVRLWKILRFSIGVSIFLSIQKKAKAPRTDTNSIIIVPGFKPELCEKLIKRMKKAE